jgi:magnesium transporter
VQVTLITDQDAAQYPVESLPELLEAGKGLVWVDVPVPDEQAMNVLSEVFGFHPRAVAECAERNHVPRAHLYPDHLFVVLHAPEEGVGGHVHYVELDQFIGRGYLVTLHGPLAPSVPVDTALRETRAVLQRVEAGRIRPRSAFRLSHAIVSTLIRHEEDFVARRARTVGALEQRVIAGGAKDPERFLDELFRVRHELLAVRTMAAQSVEIYGRLTKSASAVTGEDRKLLSDIMNQYHHVRRVADSQREFLQGVIDFYRAQTDTKMLIAAERLAVIAAVTLPVTAISSVLGMNVIANADTDFVLAPVLIAVMVAISVVLLAWTRRKGWW